MMRNLVRVGSLERGRFFVTSLTRRVGAVLGPGPNGGVNVALGEEGESRELHESVLVEVAG
jgi:hypothetical protein